MSTILPGITNMENNRLAQQIQFIIEVDKLKNIFRKSYLVDGKRRENDSEHSWHIALMAVLLAEYANDQNLDLIKVVKMLLVHDIVEIDAGDVAVYDIAARETQKIKEIAAAKRIFGLLPDDQAQEYRELWEEFEDNESSEARYARVLDRLEPILLNYFSGGTTWKEMDVTADMVLRVNSLIERGSDQLWNFVKNLTQQAVEEGIVKGK